MKKALIIPFFLLLSFVLWGQIDSLNKTQSKDSGLSPFTELAYIPFNENEIYSFKIGCTTAKAVNIVVEKFWEKHIEEELSIEEWMYSDIFYSPFMVEKEEEKEMKIEDWMFDNSYWKAKK